MHRVPHRHPIPSEQFYTKGVSLSGASSKLKRNDSQGSCCNLLDCRPRIPLHVTDIDSLIQVGRLGEDQRHDAEAIGAAVLGLFEMALEEIRDVWPGARARPRFAIGCCPVTCNGYPRKPRSRPGYASISSILKNCNNSS